MASTKYAKVAKAMKEAKTAEEMQRSWWTQRPGFESVSGRVGMELYTKRKPEMIETFAHNALTQMVEREVLEPKTRYLIILACYMMEGHWQGLVPQCCNAKAAGATEEEIMEAAFIACYAVSKAKLAETNQALGNALASPAYEKTEKL